MSTAPRIPAGSWPALMTAKTAAGYLDEPSVEAFRRKVGEVYPEPRKLQGVGERWSRAELDRWIADQTGEGALDGADCI